MKEIRETQAGSSAMSQSLDITQAQAREQRTDKAPLTREHQLREQVLNASQDRLAHMATAEERRGLPPAPENQLYLGRDPQRYGGLGGCGQCSNDQRTIGAQARARNTSERRASDAARAVREARNVSDANEARREQLLHLTKVAEHERRIQELRQAIAARHS